MAFLGAGTRSAKMTLTCGAGYNTIPPLRTTPRKLGVGHTPQASRGLTSPVPTCGVFVFPHLFPALPGKIHVYTGACTYSRVVASRCY